jgi:hypothetical protein
LADFLLKFSASATFSLFGFQPVQNLYLSIRLRQGLAAAFDLFGQSPPMMLQKLFLSFQKQAMQMGLGESIHIYRSRSRGRPTLLQHTPHGPVQGGKLFFKHGVRPQCLAKLCPTLVSDRFPEFL